VWNEAFGAELRRLELSVGGGGGGGAMEAPLVGHAHADALLDMAAGRTVGWEAGEPTRQGSNIILPHEQAPTPYIGKGQLASYEKFLFRMQHLFRKTIADATTPGGFGTVAEVTALLAMKSHKQIDMPILFGAHDAFFEKFNAALGPLLNERELPDLKNIFKDPKQAAQWVFDNKHTDEKFDLKTFVDRARTDLKAGFQKLDGKPHAIAFLGSMGERTKAAAPVMGEIAEAMAKEGNTLRVGGSPVLDPLVLKAAQKANPNAEVQGFSMTDAPVSSQKGLEYTKVEDVLVLRELMNTNVKGLVVAPEGAKQLALLFTALCDMQTGEMPKLPVVIIDPDGKFGDLKKMLGDVMLSNGRKYINPEDLDLFHITTSAKEAIAILNAPPPAPAAAH
jgi:predicted Rossmann-fold nucleotide-binding protein